MHGEDRKSMSSEAERPLGRTSRPETTPAGPPDPARQRLTTAPLGQQEPRRHPLTLASTALLLFAVMSAAAGQVMLKHGMQVATARSASSGGSLILSAVTSGWVPFGLIVFGISAFAWLAALSKVPLSIAYPFNALGYLVILTASIVILHEKASIMTWLGSLLVVSGLVIVVLSQKS